MAICEQAAVYFNTNPPLRAAYTAGLYIPLTGLARPRLPLATGTLERRELNMGWVVWSDQASSLNGERKTLTPPLHAGLDFPPSSGRRGGAEEMSLL